MQLYKTDIRDGMMWFTETITKPMTEIDRLIERNHLRIAIVNCENYPKIIGIEREDDRQVCSLWQYSMKNSRRKVKKEMKKFLRKYDKYGNG